MGHTGSDSSSVKSPSIKSHRTLSDSHKKQIELLQLMSDYIAVATGPKQFEISEIASLASFDDEKEVQRYLLILEGQKLVSPYPQGDFTSSRWQITKQGIRAVRTISRATVQ